MRRGLDFSLRVGRHGALAYLAGPVGVYRTHPCQAHHNDDRMRDFQMKIRKHFQPGNEEWRLAHAARLWCDAKRSRVSSPGWQFRVWHGDTPDSPPARRESLYVETTGERATFITALEPTAPRAGSAK